MFLRVEHIDTMSKYIGMYHVHATAGAAAAGGTSHDVTRASKGRRREEPAGAELLKSGSILEAATKNHSTVMTVIFANFIY
jgi:hypothetical protein